MLRPAESQSLEEFYESVSLILLLQPLFFMYSSKEEEMVQQLEQRGQVKMRRHQALPDFQNISIMGKKMKWKLGDTRGLPDEHSLLGFSS